VKGRTSAGGARTAGLNRLLAVQHQMEHATANKRNPADGHRCPVVSTKGQARAEQAYRALSSEMEGARTPRAIGRHGPCQFLKEANLSMSVWFRYYFGQPGLAAFDEPAIERVRYRLRRGR
jgi:hypothetical protein